MRTARNAAQNALLAITILAGAFAFSIQTAQASAGSPQTCTVGSNCEIGEFLYDDSYAPITGASCTITSREPDGTLHLNNVSLTEAVQGDGWYSHTFSAPSTTGHYRANVCCTVSGEQLCIDKSFEVTSDSSSLTESGIASAVWGYSGRTLSGFGTLVSDIWSSATRSLTSFGSLGDDVTTIKNDVSSVKSDVSTVKSDVSSVKTDVTNIQTGDSGVKSIVEENRLLLEQLVNAPIIENVIEEETPNLSEKLKNTESTTQSIASKTKEAQEKAESISNNWTRYSTKELLDKVLELNSFLGEEGDSSDSTIFGGVAHLNRSWDWQESEAAYTEVKNVKSSLLSIQTSLSSYRSSRLAYSEMKNVVSGLSRLEKSIGSDSDTIYRGTIYAKLNQTQELAGVLDEREEEVDKVLANWSEVKDDATLERKIDDLVKRIIAVNRIPRVRTILASAFDDIEADKLLKNKLLAGKGVINSNRKLIAIGGGKTISLTWMEEGSFVFKTIITNPSNLISQEVPVEYYLPQEIREEDIIDTDEGLTVEYDTDKDQYYVKGTYTLSAGETITLNVRVEDIWVISETELESMRTRATELAKPLEKTSYYAQGVTLKSDIIASVDKVQALQESAVTPEQKIRNYREAQIEYNAAQAKMDSLQNLVTDAGSAGTLFGFVGGAQAIAVWGLIIIMVAGFVFLALYMKVIGGSDEKGKEKKKDKKKKKAKDKKDEIDHGFGFAFKRMAKLALPFLLFGAVTATISGFVVAKFTSQPAREDQEVLGIDEGLDNKEEEEVKEEVSDEETTLDELGVGGPDLIRVNVPEGSSLNLREEPSLDGAVITRIKTSLEAERIGEEGEWTNIIISDETSLDSLTEGWVHSDFVEEGEDASEDIFDEEYYGTYDEDPVSFLDGSNVVIDETPTGWLRVREYAGGPEITKVYPGDIYPMVGEKSGWYEIEFGDGSSGWISSSYASIK